MPDFTKCSFKPVKTNKDLTVPQGFELASLRRHEVARMQLESKLEQEVAMEQQMREFKSKAVPDYEAL